MTRSLYLALVLMPAFVSNAQQPMPDNPTALVRQGANQQSALKINDAIYQAIGFGNTFLATTPDGNVVIDTSSAGIATRHLKLLKAVSSGPVKYIILTHGHGDHTGVSRCGRRPEHRSSPRRTT